MYASAEIRWFFPGELPSSVQDWFVAGRDLLPESERTDSYLLFPNCDSLGVKRREGKFEIKGLVAGPHPHTGTHGLTGRLDEWVKWSFESDQLQALEKELHSSGTWLDVAKKRYLLKFAYANGKLTYAKPNEEWPDEGCNVELTQLRIKTDRPHWFTLGLEAFGERGRLKHILDLTIHHFFQRQGLPPQVTLSGLSSYSYPTWIAATQP